MSLEIITNLSEAFLIIEKKTKRQFFKQIDLPSKSGRILKQKLFLKSKKVLKNFYRHTKSLALRTSTFQWTSSSSSRSSAGHQHTHTIMAFSNYIKPVIVVSSIKNNHIINTFHSIVHGKFCVVSIRIVGFFVKGLKIQIRSQ